MKQLAADHPGDSLGELADRLEDATGVRVSTLTLSRRLNELGFVRMVPPRKSRVASTSTVEAAAAAPKRYGYGPMHREKPPEALYHFGTSDALARALPDERIRATATRSAS